ncbi:MAG: mechanosensitive ion channel family protein, partial [Candidatus Rokubacteria bacterium]|nr:mechanosensitive ion channel family protein [Candidatus Rokubacteria bacterium]
MNAEISVFKILNRLEWPSLVLILGLLIGARVLASAAGWLISGLAERAPGGWRLTVLKSRPIVRLLIAVGTVLIIVPILV